MLLGKGSSLAVGRGHSFIKSSAQVESLRTALASTTLQAKPTWASKQVPQCIREYGSTLYVGLARAVSPTNTNFRLTFLLNQLQEALYEDLAV